MAGLINWKKISPPASNPDADHLYVGVDPSDCKLYIKDDTGAVFKYQTSANVAADIAAALTDYDLSTVVDSKISTAINNLINGAGSALDTLNELAAALGNDANFSTTVNTSLGNRLRVDTAAQGLNSTQKTNAKTNIDLQNVDNTSDANKPVSTAQATAIASAVTAHESASDPHSQYLTSAEGNAAYQPLDGDLTAVAALAGAGFAVRTTTNTWATRSLTTPVGSGLAITNQDGVFGSPAFTNTDKGSDAVATHVAASDPHPNYETTAELNARDTANRDRANHTGTQLSTTISDFNEAAQDAVGGILTDSASVDFTYNDAGNTITASVIPGGVNHNALLNGGGNTHIDHSTVSITAGTSLNGGGDITATRTINHNAFGTAGTYGSASTVPVFTTEVTGHISSVTNTAIAILSSAVTDFAAAVRSVVLTGISFVDSAVLATDSILVAIGKLQGQLTQRVSDFNASQAVQDGRITALEVADAEWKELIKTSANQLTNSAVTLTNVTDLAFTATAGKIYYLEYTMVFRTAATTTGLAITLGTSNTAAGAIAVQVNMPVAADGTAAGYTGSITSLGDVVIGTGVPAATTNHICTMRGYFSCTTAGTLLPQFRSEVALSNVAIAVGSIALIREF